MKRIEIVISATGETRIETMGFVGRDCLAASRFLEKALGTKSAERLTPNFHQSEAVSHNQQLENES